MLLEQSGWTMPIDVLQSHTLSSNAPATHAYFEPKVVLACHWPRGENFDDFMLAGNRSPSYQ
jgi:hypothetical protein